jgi:hypothetical protein
LVSELRDVILRLLHITSFAKRRIIARDLALMHHHERKDDQPVRKHISPPPRLRQMLYGSF